MTLTAERRACPRAERASTTWMANVLVRPGREARLIDVSDAGALIEIQTPLRPGTHIQLQLSGTHARVGVRGHVTRCYVAALAGGGGVRYRGAIAFDVPLSAVTLPGSEYQLPQKGPSAASDEGNALPVTSRMGRP
jgi:hypothetical protein